MEESYKMKELEDWEKRAIKKGDKEAKWVNGLAPVANKEINITYISYAGVNYGKELPERLKEAGVEVINDREDVEE